MSTTPIWPPSLPQKPLLSNYKETIPSNLLRSETDTGPAKVRRRGHSKPYDIEASYVISTEQLTSLSNFIENTLAGGAICFNWPRPVLTSGGYVRARFKGSDNGLLSYSLVSGTKDYWDVKIHLEIFPNVPVR